MHEIRPVLIVDRGQRIDGSVQVRASFSRKLEPVTLKQALAVVEAFETAAVRGAFAVRDGTVATLLPGTHRQDGVALCWQWTQVRLGISTLQVLRGALGGLRQQGILCLDLVVTSVTDPAVQVGWPSEDESAPDYPPLGPQASNVWRVAGSEGRARQVLIQFGEENCAAFVDDVRAWVRPWLRLLEAGAFAMPVAHPAVACSITGSVSQFDSQTIEIGIDRFEASESAWFSLANLLCSHPRLVQLIRVIEVV